MSVLHTLSIIIPTYNEEKTICLLLNKLKNVVLTNNIKKEIIIVNDCSTDKTELVIKKYISENTDLPISYFYHQTNKGKGAALQTGIKNALGEFLIIQDADLEYNPNEYNILLQPIIDNLTDVVYGSRFIKNNDTIFFCWHTMGNKFLTFLSNLFTSFDVTDMETCYKVFNTKMIQSIDLKEKGFGFEPEITAKISKIPQIRITEIPISYTRRTYKEGKKITWKDGFRAIYCILKYNLFK